MLEIERKYLVKPEIVEILNKIVPVKLKQGYLTKNELGSVRVRIEYYHESLFYSENQIDHAYLMSKTKVDDMSNQETVDEITVKNAETLIKNFCNKVIDKYRYIINLTEPDGKNRKWELDVFENPNPGLMLAELEISSKDELIWLPPWIDREVTGDPQYYNANM